MAKQKRVCIHLDRRTSCPSPQSIISGLSVCLICFEYENETTQNKCY